MGTTTGAEPGAPMSPPPRQKASARHRCHCHSRRRRRPCYRCTARAIAPVRLSCTDPLRGSCSHLGAARTLKMFGPSIAALQLARLLARAASAVSLDCAVGFKAALHTRPDLGLCSQRAWRRRLVAPSPDGSLYAEVGPRSTGSRSNRPSTSRGATRRGSAAWGTMLPRRT